MPSLFSFIDSDPDKAEAKRNEAEVVAKITKQVLARGCRLQGLCIDDDGPEYHFSRFGISENPEKDKQSARNERFDAALTRHLNQELRELV